MAEKNEVETSSNWFVMSDETSSPFLTPPLFIQFRHDNIVLILDRFEGSHIIHDDTLAPGTGRSIRGTGDIGRFELKFGVGIGPVLGFRGDLSLTLRFRFDFGFDFGSRCEGIRASYVVVERAKDSIGINVHVHTHVDSRTGSRVGID